VAKGVLVGVCTLHCSDVLPNSAKYTHQQGPTNTCNHITTNRCVLTTVTLASTSNVLLPDDGVTAPKHVGAVLMSILM
jgi:hypothetical protein